MENPFVTTEWLAARLADPTIVILDGSWFLPTANRRPYEEYLAGHIPGAVYFDMDEIADKSTGLPHMLPSAEVFAREVGALGIGDGMTVVCVKTSGRDEQEMLWEADPQTYSKPAYLWPSGWVAVSLAPADWALVEGRLRSSWKLAAPKRLTAAP